jgi:hypothetical protein
MEVLQFSWDTLLFTDGSSYACQSWQHRMLICQMVV